MNIFSFHRAALCFITLRSRIPWRRNSFRLYFQSNPRAVRASAAQPNKTPRGMIIFLDCVQGPGGLVLLGGDEEVGVGEKASVDVKVTVLTGSVKFTFMTSDVPIFV